MQNKTLLTIIVLIILLLGGYFLFSKPKDVVAPPVEEKTAVQNTVAEETPAVNKAPKKYEITFSADGFSPAVLNIAVGDTVAFVNKSDGAFWPASNSHPIHADYSEFDAKTEIGTGKTYEFTFTKAGEWGYHNHLNPKMMGVVVVK
jgi:plastocyanin